MDLQEIRHRKAHVIIGKNGLSIGTLKLIQDLIKKNSFVKIKILKSALATDYSKEKLVEEIITKTNLHLIEIRGYSAIISLVPPK
ncbi:MAG: YhbY family RNA-binding protein [Promethearchaeota archaeon]